MERLSKSLASWTHDAIVILLGKSAGDAAEPKTTSLHLWLLGLAFPESAIAIRKSGEMVIWTSTKKLEYLRPLEGPGVKLMARTPPMTGVESGQLEAFCQEVLAGAAGATVGLMQKEAHEGPFAEAVLNGLGDATRFNVKDCREEVSQLLGAKDEEELTSSKKAAFFCTLIMKDFFAPRLEELLDNNTSKSTSKFCDEIHAIPDDASLMKLWASQHGLEDGELEISEVSLQHGKALKLKAVAPEHGDIPMTGTYLLSLSARYFEYHACLTRTIIVDPAPEQKKAYLVALEAHQAVIKALSPGKPFRDLYLLAKSAVGQQAPALVPKLSQTVGWLLGLEARDSLSYIMEKSTRVVERGMVLNIAVGFVENLADGTGQAWAVWMSDTVIVPLQGAVKCETVTSACSKLATDVIYEVSDGLDGQRQQSTASPAQVTLPVVPTQPTQENKAPPAGKAKAKTKAKAKAKEKAPAPGKQAPAAAAPRRAAASNVAPKKVPPAAAGASAEALRSSRRLRDRNEQTKNDLRDQVQMDAQMVQKRALLLEAQKKRLRNQTFQREEADSMRAIAKKKVYSSPNELPSNLRPKRIHVDTGAEALLLPLFGTWVPFNARVVKNITKSRSDQTEYIRVNFVAPGTQGKNAADFPLLGGKRLYIREMSFKSDTVDNFELILRAFKELQKNLRQKDAHGGGVKLASEAGKGLQLTKGSSFPCITDVQMRPNVTGSRRTLGNLEAHSNGFRFNLRGASERVDIMYSQVKVAVFEPCAKHTLMALVHLHLHEPIIFGARKTQDVQFFTEVGSASEDLSQRRVGSVHDPDEIQEEQFDRLLRKRLNEAFHAFAKKVEALPGCKMKFDFPFHEIKFSGVPFKANVDLCPCGQALVALQSWPPFVLSLADVECVVFERDIMTLQELDISFVLKDYEKHPPRITAIPRKHRESIRNWLFDNDLVWYSSGMNLNWKEVMAFVTKDLQRFVDNGGWNNWFDDADSSGESGSSDDGESDYKASGSDAVSSAVDADDSDEDASGLDDDDESDDDSEPDGEDSGEDWDELERKAEGEDRRRDAQKKRAARVVAPNPKGAKRARR